MPAVVRVKRRIDDEPLSAFVLNGKRRRLEEENASAINTKDELSTLLKFAGTIKEQDDTATTQIARLSKEEAKELVMQKSHKPLNATDKTRQEIRHNQQEQRFRVVNCQRTTLDEESDSTKSKEITIVDIEKQFTNDKTVEIPETMTAITNLNPNLSEPSTSSAAAAAAAAAASAVALATPTDSDTGYVYDLYIPDNDQQAEYVDLMDDNYLSVLPFHDLIYEDVCNDNDDTDEYDSEDSNQENYFTNDYPDEYEYVDKKLLKQLNNFTMASDDDEESNGDGNDSSSDDGAYSRAYRDPYVHYIDPEEKNFCEDADQFFCSSAGYTSTSLKGNSSDDDSYDDNDYGNYRGRRPSMEIAKFRCDSNNNESEK